jgi:NAD(P)-dependent dehydrogenase (short-subunit alcohol dehydrogenase family)
MSKVILVTGSSRGFGRLAAELLAGRGHTVYATMRDPTGRNASAAQELRQQCTVLELDVTDEASIERAVQQIVAKEGRLDALVSNAGYGMYGALEDIPVEAVQRQFEINFFGPLRLVRQVAPIMRGQGSGVIVQISSFIGLLALPTLGAYQASKAAVESAFESLSYELAHFGVRVTLIAPGEIDTDFQMELPDAVKDGSSAYMALLQQMESVSNPEAAAKRKPEELAVAVVDAIENPNTPLRVRVVTEFENAAIEMRRRQTDAEYKASLWQLGKLNW